MRLLSGWMLNDCGYVLNVPIFLVWNIVLWIFNNSVFFFFVCCLFREVFFFFFFALQRLYILRKCTFYDHKPNAYVEKKGFPFRPWNIVFCWTKKKSFTLPKKMAFTNVYSWIRRTRRTTTDKKKVRKSDNFPISWKIMQQQWNRFAFIYLRLMGPIEIKKIKKLECSTLTCKRISEHFEHWTWHMSYPI